MRHEYHADRRSFLKAGGLAGAAIAAGATFAEESLAWGITKGDIAILRLLSAIEQIESDLWQQYAELGGVQDSEIPGLPTGGNTPYTKALNTLDSDMSQYIHDNTDDEFTHHDFLNAYLQFVGAQQVNLSKFATLKGSQATGANKNKLRLTNLMQLTVDTSWWTRYRSRTQNPDLNNPNFAQAVPDLVNNGPFPAIPRDDNDATLDPKTGNPSPNTQAIANTAAFHFGFIEQGGTSLYPTLALRVTNPVVLRILLSIGPSETMHFQVWHDKAGNAVSDPLAPLTVTDRITKKSLMFPNLNALKPPLLEDFQTNLIMPEPCPFLTDLNPPKPFPAVSIIRPVSTNPKIFGAVQAVNGFIADGLFIGQSREFFKVVGDLAEDAEQATRQC